MLDAFRERLQIQVPELKGRVETASEFVALQKAGARPSGDVAAFVLPSGLTGGTSQILTGVFRQEVRRGVSLVLMFQSTGALGRQILKRLDGFGDEVFLAICGWTPDDTTGVFELQSARIVPSENGLLSYLIDFRINDQLRVDS